AANHQGASARAGATSRDTRLLLRRQRRADQKTEELFRERWRDTQLRGDAAHAKDHLALAFVIASRVASSSLHARNLAADGFALGYQRNELPVDIIQAPAQVIQRHVIARHGKILKALT